MRKRKVSDDEIFNAVQRAMQHHGPDDLTLAHIAAEAGVTPGLLVQRFGGKRELLLAVSSSFAGSAPAFFETLREAHYRPLATLRAYAACMAEMASTPDALARNFAYLQLDLTDEPFRQNLLANAIATRMELEELVRSAIRAGELRRTAKPHCLARVIEAVIGGSLMSWACYRSGPAAAWLAEDLETVLAPYLRPVTGKGLQRPRGRSR